MTAKEQIDLMISQVPPGYGFNEIRVSGSIYNKFKEHIVNGMYSGFKIINMTLMPKKRIDIVHNYKR